MPSSSSARRRFNRGFKGIFRIPSRILDHFESRIRGVREAKMEKERKLRESQRRFTHRR